MTAVIWVLAAMAYVAIGWLIMAWDMPRLYVRVKEYRIAERCSTTPEAINESVRPGAAWTLVAWPLKLPYLLACRSAYRHDPARLEREIAERDAKIAELEQRYLE